MTPVQASTPRWARHCPLLDNHNHHNTRMSCRSSQCTWTLLIMIRSLITCVTCYMSYTSDQLHTLHTGHPLLRICHLDPSDTPRHTLSTINSSGLVNDHLVGYCTSDSAKSSTGPCCESVTTSCSCVDYKGVFKNCDILLNDHWVWCMIIRDKKHFSFRL